ncbi:MAG: thioredoxin family protein [Methanoregulaceae archaeon]|nr:thioredoxin family protein [Methanoregulaceae archaeon]
MKKSMFVLVGLLVVALAAAQTPPPAEKLIGDAQAKAARSGKAVFVRFTASWCGWCHKMQSVLDSPSVKPIWTKYFESVAVVVLENADKMALENPGGAALMEAQGGKGQGIPYFFFVDAKSGKTIVNSLMPAVGDKKPANVGCPYAPEEVAFFVKLLEKAAPKMTAAERLTIEEGFKALSKKDG